MQNRTATWEAITEGGDYTLQTVAMIGETEYTEISAPHISRALFQGQPSIGNCTAASMEVSIRTTDTIPKGAEVKIKMRVWNEEKTEHGEWLPAGTFYVSKRQADYATGLVTLTCYDAMLKTRDDFYLDDPQEDLTGWPLPMADVVDYIADRIGVEVDSRTSLPAYTIPATPTGQMMDVLGHIAACAGGNWIITPEGKLRLVPFAAVPAADPLEDARVRFVTDLGLSYAEAGIIGDNDDTFTGYWYLNNGILTQTDIAPEVRTKIEAILSSLGTSDPITVSRVTIMDDMGDTYTAGDDTGYEIAVDVENPYASQSVCDALLTQLGGITYYPFEADQTIYDPAAELGDTVTYFDVFRGIICSENATLNVAFRSNIGAPANTEVEDEFPYISRTQKNIDKVADAADAAAKVAVNYIARDDTGLMVADMADGTQYTPSTVPAGVKNTFIDSDSVEIRDGQTVLASFGEQTRLGKENSTHLDLSSSGMDITGSNPDNSVHIGAQTTSAVTQEEGWEFPGYNTDDSGTIPSITPIDLPDELITTENISVAITGGSTHTFPAGTAFTHTGTDYKFTYDGDKFIEFENLTTSAIDATIGYKVSEPTNYLLQLKTANASRVKVTSASGGTVYADGGLYANNAGNFGLFDSLRAKWAFVINGSGDTIIPGLKPVLLSADTITAPATQMQAAYKAVALTKWAAIGVYAHVNNVSTFLIFIFVGSKLKQYVSDTYVSNNTPVYFRGGFWADWSTNRVYVTCANGPTNAHQYIKINRIFGLLRK